jgi:hypothetical protein
LEIFGWLNLQPLKARALQVAGKVSGKGKPLLNVQVEAA